jgi:hypothetical protein
MPRVQIPEIDSVPKREEPSEKGFLSGTPAWFWGKYRNIGVFYGWSC